MTESKLRHQISNMIQAINAGIGQHHRVMVRITSQESHRFRAVRHSKPKGSFEETRRGLYIVAV